MSELILRKCVSTTRIEILLMKECVCFINYLYDLKNFSIQNSGFSILNINKYSVSNSSILQKILLINKIKFPIKGVFYSDIAVYKNSKFFDLNSLIFFYRRMVFYFLIMKYFNRFDSVLLVFYLRQFICSVLLKPILLFKKISPLSF